MGKRKINKMKKNIIVSFGKNYDKKNSRPSSQTDCVGVLMGFGELHTLYRKKK